MKPKPKPPARTLPRSAKAAGQRRTPASRAPASASAPARRTRVVPFPIVGIGASAGGLEALEQFIQNVPPDSGIACVIVQHLDPTHKGILPELLQRHTTMRVLQVRDRTRVRPNRVYVIPPNKAMSLLHGLLYLFEPSEPRGQRLPIDFFLRSLAQDRRERGVGVILSGMGADGTLGLRAIKEHAGLGLVQDPATARYDGMPCSAINAGLADIVAPVRELPGRILAFLERAPLLPGSATGTDPENPTRNALEKAVILLRARTGHDFTLYKRTTLCRRIERRMGLHQIAKMPAYVRHLQANPQELDLLFKELLIGVTSFFRDPGAWEQLRTEALPALLAARSPGRALRAWVAGCSTGEEAYSLAITFREAVEAFEPGGNFALQIFATDLDRDSIDRARQGLYPHHIAADVTPKRLERYFVREDRGYRVGKEIRQMLIFAAQSLVMDPPFTKLDLLSCRNVLIYLTAEVQRKLIPLFHFSLNPGGLLFLGSAETTGTTGGPADLFVPLDAKSRIFRRSEANPPTEPVEFPSSFGKPTPRATEIGASCKPPPTLQSLADQLILQRHAPPAVLVSDHGDVFYVSGRTGRYLEPSAGKANWNIFAMAREGLRLELSGAFHRALRLDGPVALQGLKVATDGGDQGVDVTLQRLTEPGPLHGLVLIVFTEVPTPPPAPDSARKPASPGRRERLGALERELQRAQSEARSTQVDMQTAQEELRSANEELQSTNEELQSANEELMTSKEEMQSLNEELQTLNTELQAKVDELSRASSDVKNLLDSTDIATLFLDPDLNVRRFTARATQFIRLIPGDVGRPVTDLVLGLDYPQLADHVRGVLRTLVSTEQVAAGRNGRRLNVRIMPYRTMDDLVDGVVITFADITAAWDLEVKLRAQHAALEARLADGSRAPGPVRTPRTRCRPTRPGPG